MKLSDARKLSADEWDEAHDPRPGPTDFDRIVDAALSRRGFLSGLVVTGSGAAAMGLGGFAASGAKAATSRFAFTPIEAQTDFTVHVPEGYEWKPLVKWGQPLFSDAPEFDHATGGTSQSMTRAFGENTDGMESFVIEGRQVLAINSEYANPEVNLPHAADGVPTSLDDVRKLQAVQGVNVIEIAEGPDGWAVVVDSKFNRRIDHNTPMRLAGPAAGHDLLKTAGDPSGMTTLGTMNNCGSGRTPWGTYLTCEENFNGYFGSTDPNFERPADFVRYGVNNEGWYGYELFDERFDVSKNPNEPRTQGYVTEIDPANPQSMPVKRTALGRFKHENAEVVVNPDGRVVVYMGDDERGEFMYRYVSNGVYAPGGDTSTLLDDGKLSVAKFSDDGTGEWIELTEESTGMSYPEILIFTRMAGSKVGATTMDRPEWIAANPLTAEAYCCLTNNTRRGVKPNAGGDETPVGGPNPRAENQYGQIVRWRPDGGDHTAKGFSWDLYVMAGNPTVHDDAFGGSDNVNAGNLFNSPDGMAFDSTGIVWIQTDGDDSNEGDFAGMGNNQMLAGDPVTGEIVRFLTGPNGCEVTGLCWSADLKTMFVGIQHPSAPFPDGEGKLPRSTVIQVKRIDNAAVG